MSVILPVYKTFLATDDIPWEQINSDLYNNGDTRFQEIEEGISTVELRFRRDLEDWATGFRFVVEKIVQKFMPYTANYGYEDWTKISWVNKIYPNGFVKYHSHYPCDLAIVWYIDIPDNSGNFILQYENNDYVVPISTGDVLAFPAGMIHSTEPNQSGKPRYVMATNVLWTEMLRQTLKDKLTEKELNTLLNKVYYERQNQLIKDMLHESNFTQISN
jgi:hypothetical protein